MRSHFMSWVGLVCAASLLGVLSSASFAQTPDTNPPVLTGFVINPIAVNTTTSAATVTATWQITDDLSGVAGGSARFGSPSGMQASICSVSLISGTNLNGTFQCQMSIPAYSEAGSWTVSYVNMVDNVNNQTTLSASDLLARGFPTKFEVTTGPVAGIDTVGPTASSVTVNPNPVAVNSTSALTAMISDANTGGSKVTAAYYSIVDGTPSQMVLTLNGKVTTGASATLLPFTLSNIYRICVRGTDQYGNTGANTCGSLPVYNPAGGSITGEGQVMAPVSPYNSRSSTATFDFKAKYVNGAATPSGSLEIEIEGNGNLHFQSSKLDWLVLSSSQRHAIIRGSGRLNNKDVCKFEADAWAGSFQPGNTHALGLKLFECVGGSNNFDLPTAPLAKGRILIER